jgi:hypothetical protein
MSAQDSSKILHAIGTVKFERRTDGSFWVRHPIEGRVVFDPGEEFRAREYFQSVARAEKGYPSGFDPCGNGNAACEASKGLNARLVRKMCKDWIPLGDFLELCSIDLGKLLECIDAAEGPASDKARLKERLKQWET